MRLGLPGAVGAFAGATLFSNLSLATAKPVMVTILTLIGIHLVLRFSTGRRASRGTGAPANPRTLGFLGLFGGFVDAAGGGGWGPVTSSTLITIGKTEPRRIVGTVNTAEFLVTFAASLGFILGMWQDLTEHLLAVLALLAGGVLAAPVAAWLVTRINPTALGRTVRGLKVEADLLEDYLERLIRTYLAERADASQTFARWALEADEQQLV